MRAYIQLCAGAGGVTRPREGQEWAQGPWGGEEGSSLSGSAPEPWDTQGQSMGSCTGDNSGDWTTFWKEEGSGLEL